MEYSTYIGLKADEHARTLEEQWIDGFDSNPTNADSAGAESTTRPSPIILGLMCGFFFPLLPLFFLQDSLPPYAWANGASVHVQSSVIFSYVTTQVSTPFKC
jgi:hypothetical protein